jgi:4-methoxybenzoate monooxygenase (O-demethylating)
VTEAPRLGIDPFDEAFLADPYAHHAALREAGPVVWLEPIGAYAMARHAEVQAALRDHETYCSGRGVGLADFAKETPWRPPSLLLEADPPLHTRTRMIVNRILSLASLKAVRPRWEAEAEALVDELVQKRSFDAVAELSEAYPMRVFPDAVGVPKEERELLPVYGGAVFNAFGPRNAVFERGNAEAADAIAWVAKACKRESLTPGGWGMALYEASDRGECSADEAERMVRSFLSAGVDTTINGIGHLILALATHPDAWARLRADPSLARKAFEESLRWDSTVQTFFRTTTREVEVEGVTLPEGAKVLLFLAAANRDPRQWDDPDRFDLDRQTGAQVAFGYGIHRCVGQMVARQEAELVLAALLPRVRAIRLTGAPQRRLNNTVHALAGLPVELEAA